MANATPDEPSNAWQHPPSPERNLG
jgi:hypothetical protein